MKGRVAVFTAPGRNFELREFPLPEVEPEAVLVKVRLANICGSDLHTWRGETQIPNADPDGYVFGHEMVGQIFKLGNRVRTDSLGRILNEGDRITFTYFYPCHRCWYCLNGQLASCPSRFTRFGPRTVKVPPYFTGAFGDFYYLRPGGYIFKVPESLPDEIAVAANCVVSQVMFAFSQMDLKLGDRLVIQGAGGLGLYAAAVAKERGASKVIVVDRLEERLQTAKAFGADETILIKEGDDPLEHQEFVFSLTEGRGADLVVEAVGLPRVIPEGLRLLRANGTYLLLGCIGQGQTFNLDPGWLVASNKRLVGLSNYDPWVLPRALDFLVNAQVRYPFYKLSSHRYSLEDINVAFREADWMRGKQDSTRVIRASIAPEL